MRQGLLSEPQASSGPAAMLLAVSRSPSSIPRRSPCPARCHLPLAFLNHIHLSKSQKHPRLHPLPERCHLPLASLNHIHLSKPQKHPRLHPLPERCHLPLASLYTSASQNPDNIHPGTMPPSSGVPLYIRLTKSRQHPPRSAATFLRRPSIHPPHESTSPSRTRSVRLSPPLRYQSSTKESKELTGILPIMIWINAFFSSKRKV